MRRIIHALLASAILISSLPVSVIAEETSSSQQILDFLQQDPSAAGAEGNGYTVTPASPIITETFTYQDGRFSMEVPKGWEVLSTGYFADTLCVRAWDPDCPSRCFFRCTKLEPFLRDTSAKMSRSTMP